MKRKNNLYHNTYQIENIMNIYNSQVRLNTKNKRKIEKFEDYLVENLVLIKTILEEKKYSPQNYNIFMIKEPKARIIMSQTIQDKIINHIVSKYCLLNVFEKKLIDSNVATRKYKGTKYGIELTKKYLSEMKIKHDGSYILKCDIKKYFYTIDHNVLKSKIYQKIKDKNAIDVIYKIIDSTNEEYININLNNIKSKEKDRVEKLNITEIEKELKIKELNKIPYYNKEKGIPIGNMSSQVFALIYLNDLDHFIKENLKINYYIRYMDDFILIHHDKEYLRECLKILEEKLKKEYKLILNEKTQIINIKNGLDFLGFRFYIKNNKIIMKVRNHTKKRFKKKIKKMNDLVNNKQKEEKELMQMIASYRGHLSYGNTKKLTENTLRKVNERTLKRMNELEEKLTVVNVK